jgi:tetratricopeptide (TPR) repeat protein
MTGPTDPHTLLSRGREQLARGELVAALATFDDAVQHDPGCAEAHAGRGDALFRLDRFEESVEAFTAALRHRPECPALLRGRGKAHFENNDNEAAILDLDEALRLRPDDAEAACFLAASFHGEGDDDLAYDYLEEALRLDPRLPASYFFRGRVRANFGDEDGALADYTTAIHLDPNCPYPYGYRAGIWEGLEEHDKALADRVTSLRLKPSAAAYHAHGHWWQGRGDYEKGVAAFAEAVRLDPRNTHHYGCRSRLFDEMGEVDKADTDLETIQKIQLEAEGLDVNAVLEQRMAVYNQIQEHFAAAPLDSIEVTTREFPARVAADLQLALDRLAGNGFDVPHFWAARQGGGPVQDFPQLYTRDRRNPPTPVPPEYVEVNVGEQEPVRCLKFGLWLLGSAGTNFLVMLDTQNHCGIHFQVAAGKGPAGQAATQRFFRYLEETIQKGDCYRGKVLSLEHQSSYSGQAFGILVHKLRPVQRDEVILPPATLALLERNVIQFVRQRARLRQLGLATKKGLLFYGPPGTGKTHTIHYLARGIEGQTTFLVSAEQVGLLGEYMTLARLFQPSMVVIEDVDLIARDRMTMHSAGEEVLLNKLLNEMDGLKPESDILFVLTTNHPQKLEAALASRPGRIDQAIEFPLPDEDGRAKLVRLYSRGVEVPEEVAAVVVQKTERVSASFIKELMRRATQFYLEREGSGPLAVHDVEDALEEMLFRGGSLNRVLLGAADNGAPS